MISLQSLANELECQFKGDGETEISAITTIDQTIKTGLSFLHDDRYAAHLAKAQGTIILSEKYAKSYQGNCIITDMPYVAYAKAANIICEKNVQNKGIHDTAVIHETAEIANDITIGAYCVIGQGVKIGKGTVLGQGVIIEAFSELGNNCRVFSNVTIKQRCRLGNHVSLDSGTVIGSDGFGFARNQEHWIAIPQIGGVCIDDRVSIGANCTVDAGAINATHIHSDVIIDNLVQIAHNVTIGSGTAIAACVGISGSTKIGKNCMIGGQTGIAGHLNICDQVTLLAKTQVTKSIKSPGCYSSIIGFQIQTKWNKNAARLRQLDRLMNQQTKRTT